ncbi:hypothetical protein ACI2UK_24470 [Ralstonia nicotianae]|uniref:hypothetical protein n=1 Tax=Ralstonia pseudosolanacearum TaxID=1310165 RepID=UPI0020068C37|nr:hypothetical protein [Ralstonia pseudosolanacearum]MCK4120404.1 hypothetical protein [Ralstonia pseudosolanacearum]
MTRINISTASLDARCKGILTEFVRHGWDKAGVNYQTHVSVVPLADFNYLLQHGGLSFPTPQGSEFRPILHSYATPKFGPDVGTVTFSLNADLS